LGDETAQLVAIHKTDTAFVDNPIDIQSETGPTYILGHSHSTVQETISWLKDPHRSVFCFPANTIGPDLILVLKLSDGQMLRVLVQFKHINENTLGASETRKAISTTDPDCFISRLLPEPTDTSMQHAPRQGRKKGKQRYALLFFLWAFFSL
jgi:hypothetical protein